MMITYPPFEAEWLSDQLLDSKELSCLLTKVLQGDISPTEYLCSLSYVAESFHLTFLEQQRRLAREAFYDCGE